MGRTRTFIFFLCIVLAVSILSGCGKKRNSKAHLGYPDISAIYQEILWVNLDINAEQRKQIDEIIVEGYQYMQFLQKGQKHVILRNSIEMYALANYLNQVNTIRESTNSKIMQVLSPQQRSLFENQLEKSQELTEKTLVMILSLDSETQQIVIAKLLLKGHDQVWSIVANKSLSWEERTAKISKLRTIKRIRKLADISGFTALTTSLELD